MKTWFDERVGTDILKKVLLDRKIPKIPRLSSWFFTLGSICLFLFMVQAMTGIFLAMNYSPSTDHAYDSVKYIMGIPSGAFIRGLHVWGATFMVMAVFVHMLRVFIMGAYKFPREMTWITGVCLLLLVIGYGFTGYLLPWNQRAYWATVVGLRISEQVPYVGEYIGSILKGGPAIGVRTLTRFFTFHGFLFMAIFIPLVIFHLYLVVRNGIAGFPERIGKALRNRHNWKQAVNDRYHELKSSGESFFPYVVYKDVIAITVICAALFCLAIYFPPELGEVADPTDKNQNPRPEWYFLFLFQLLKYVPPQFETVAIVFIPAVLIGFLFLLPFIDRYSHRHPFDRPIITGLGLVAVLGMVYLGVEGYRAPLTNPIVEKNLQLIEGQRLFAELRCQSCHSIAGKGGVVAPALDIVGSRQSKEWLTQHFLNPQKVSPGTVMPNFGLLDEEIAALVVYMSSLGGGSFTPKAPELFKENCASCHKIGDVGEELGPDLSRVGQYREQGWLIKYIENPEKVDPNASMPGFAETLSPADIEDLARYLSAQRGISNKK